VRTTTCLSCMTAPGSTTTNVEPLCSAMYGAAERKWRTKLCTLSVAGCLVYAPSRKPLPYRHGR
jgi:hypothetical protein